MRKHQRVIAGIGAFSWLPAYAVMFGILASTNDEGEVLSALETVLVVAMFLTLFVTIAGIVYMVRHVYVESDLSEGWKSAWTFCLLFFNVFAAPIYWLSHMARQPPRAPELGPPMSPESLAPYLDRAASAKAPGTLSRYACPVCGAVFFTERGMRNHARDWHSEGAA
jgi:hypothetical protein